MSRARNRWVGIYWPSARNRSVVVGGSTTRDWFALSKNSRRALAISSLVAAYAAFGTIVWGAYLALDASPRRVAPVSPEPVQHQTLAHDSAWQEWMRRRADLKARIEAMLSVRPPKLDEPLPADPSPPTSHAPDLALAPMPMPPMPALKLVPATTSASLWTAPTPRFKPADAHEGPRIVPAMDRARGGNEPVNLWSRITALFEPASASPVRTSEDNNRNNRQTVADGNRFSHRADALDGGTTSSASRGEGGTGSATGRGQDNDRSVGGTQSDGRDRSANDDRGRDRAGDRDRGGNDRGRGSASDRDRSDSNDRGRDSAGGRGSNDRGRDSASDRDRGVGNDGNRGDRGGRGERGDRGDRGRGRD